MTLQNATEHIELNRKVGICLMGNINNNNNVYLPNSSGRTNYRVYSISESDSTLFFPFFSGVL
jgi:hypothetical protein